MIPFPLLSPLTGAKLKADTPHSLIDRETGRRFPVADDIPFLRTGREDLSREALALLDRGEPGRALELLLADQDDWWQGPPADPAAVHDLVRDVKYASLRDAVARLGWGRVGDYFLHRWTDPTYLAGLALLEAHWNQPKCTFELACGIGHYLRALHERGSKVAGGDVVFAKLWVARHWVVGHGAQLVCFDANAPHWPIAGAPADLVMCHDAFYFLSDKAEVLARLRATAGEEGWLSLSHIHNRANAGFSAGHAMAAAEIEELFPDALVYDDADLTRSLVEARAPVPAEPTALTDCEAFSVVCGPGMRPAPRAVADGITLPPEGTALRLNPLYERAEVGDEAAYHIRWPSPRYEAEYAPRATYPLTSPGPAHVTMAPPVAERARRREFVALPERW